MQPKQILNSAKKLYKNKLFYPSVIMAVLCIVLLVISYFGSTPSVSRLNEGEVSLKTVYAPYGFTYPTSVDEEKTEAARAEFEKKVVPVYDIDVSVEQDARRRIGGLFDSVREVQIFDAAKDREKVKILGKKAEGAELSERDLFVLLKLEDVDRAESNANDAIENVFLLGMIDAEKKTQLLKEKTPKVLIRNTRLNVAREVETKELVVEEDAKRILYSFLDKIIIEDKVIRRIVFKLLRANLATNVRLNEEETLKRRAQARGQVPVIYKRDVVKKNEVIIERGRRISKDDIAKLVQIGRLHSTADKRMHLFGLIMLLTQLILVAAIYLAVLERRQRIDVPKNVLLVGINIVIAIAAALLIMRSGTPHYLIPLASIAMMLVLLTDFNIAFVVTLGLSVYVGFLAGGSLNLALVLFTGSAIGMYAVRGSRRRSQIFLAGFIVSLVNVFSIAGIGFLNNVSSEAILKQSLYGFTNGIISSFIVIGLLPVFEYVFNLVTNITLLEISDLGHPLLKELAIKAPGTYHHSLLVGNLTEEACNSIGADSLLARVGAYYHDIGKIGKAEYFAENEKKTQSKHDKLTASMSALVITNHVKDGVELAKKHNLNKAIINFIIQHHGTSLIYYFYQRALEKAKSEDELKEEEFRYGGPKPQTKETAIVLLADSVEAASRMLSDPTPARIRGLVYKIVNNKFVDGQLDECDLTLKDLHDISESFVRALTGVFHTRLDYPEAKPAKPMKNR